VINVCMKN